MPLRSLSEWCEHLSGFSARNPKDAPPNAQSAQQADALSVSQLSSGTRQADCLLPAAGNFGQGACTSLLSSSDTRLLQSVSRPAMACEFEVLLNEHQYPTGVEHAMESLQIIEQVERLVSVYRPQSQFSKVNQFAGQRPVLVDAWTLELIQLGIDVHEFTQGAFDLTAGSLSETWGFARRQGSMPSPQQIRQSLECVGSQFIRLDSNASTVALDRPGLRLNPGGIGKGFALDYAAQHLQASGIEHFMMHGGLSSIIARGGRSGLAAQHWLVSLKHPWRSDETLEMISLENQALGTSGSGKQFFHFGGKRYSHLIDPRTGWPADQLMSATVICSSGAVADALATALFILGPQAATEFCEAHPEVAAILIFTDPKSGRQRLERRNWPD